MSETAKNEITAASETPTTEYIASMRLRVRTSVAKLDEEIKDLINAARNDLVLGGVLPVWVLDESDALIKQAISTYVKAEFGLDNEDSEKYRASYEKQKIALALSDDYIKPGQEA